MPIRFGKNISDEDAKEIDKLLKEQIEYFDKMQYVMKIRNNSRHIWSFLK